LVCVLVSHAIKNTQDTDPAELGGMNKLRHTQEVIDAVKKAFPELTGGTHGALDEKKR
jgi:hypothetical protein